MRPVLYIVIPCYNEEDVLPIMWTRFLGKLIELQEQGLISAKSRILFVDDGSKDKTWELIRSYAAEDGRIMGIRQSRNRGHQSAVLAGMMEARQYCDIVITADCDGQDDPDAMNQMVEEYLKGNEIVYGVRSTRAKDTWFKRWTAQTFYKIMRKLGADIIPDHADYRLVSKRVLEAFSEYEEVNLFLRGMFPLVGFKSTCVMYEREERQAGKTHYPLKSMIALAVNGITGLSDKPLYLVAKSGVVMTVLGIIATLFAVIHGSSEVSILIGIMIVLAGLELAAIGIVGIYVGKTYLETKHRPRYIISERTVSMDLTR